MSASLDEPIGLWGQRRAAARKFAWALWRDKVTFFSLVTLTILIVCALFAGLVAPYDPLRLDLTSRLLPPFSTSGPGQARFHLLGTDQLGRDTLSRIIYGARVSMAVGFSGVVLSAILGLLLGLLAGYRRGVTDDVIMRIVDLQMGFPFIVFAIFVLYAIGPGLTNLVAVLVLVRWPLYARVARGLTMSLRETSFIEAARSVGCSDRRIMFRHLLPNLIAPTLVVATLELARMIITESSLSFLGIGIRAPTPSWGNMISEGRLYMRSAWWLITFPGLAILATALSANLLGTWMRAVTDPAQRWRWMTDPRRTRRRAGSAGAGAGAA